MTLMYPPCENSYFFYYSKVISTVFQEVYCIVHTSEYTVLWGLHSAKNAYFFIQYVHRHLLGDQLKVKYM